MEKYSSKYILDFIPFVAQLVSSTFMVFALLTDDIIPDSKQIIGLVFVFITLCMFLIRHAAGVVALGITLLIGFIGYLTLNVSVQTNAYFFRIGSVEWSTGFFQPVFLFWLIIHFILSYRCYQEVLSNARVWFNEFKVRKHSRLD